MWDAFDQILYINLEDRKDRKASIEKQLESVDVPKGKITRIEAHASINGARGCALSHIKALDYAMDEGLERIVILEDDVIFLTSKEKVEGYLENFLAFTEKEPWDVFFLGTNPHQLENTNYPNIKRVLSSSCAHAYIVERRYIPSLRDSYVLSYEKLWKTTSLEESFFYAIDKLWTSLQIKDGWFVGEEMILRQGDFYSDIELKHRSRFPSPVTPPFGLKK